ncbi:MAG: YchF/TatD family DNA exonuclease [Candidatus Magasanikbacteria bacterium]|nr:YchF/TatD family DNA exonuclease [Candidatus Magasanikbacteria bacterium]
MIIDSHCHLQFGAFEKDRDEVLKRCKENNMLMNVVGTQRDTSAYAVRLSKKYDNVYASVGLHPIQEYSTRVIEENDDFLSRSEDFDRKYYQKLLDNKKVIAVGETGLDRFHIRDNAEVKKIFFKQKLIFFEHYLLAKKNNLPLVIHVRDAHREMLELLNGLDLPIRGVVHCYSGNWDQAKKYLSMGLHLGFTGVVTFPPKKSDPSTQLDLLEVVKKAPIDRILVETDSPYLAPQKYRGKRCEPWMVNDVIKKIAEIRDISYDEFKKNATENTLKLFTKIDKKIG